MLPDFQHLCAHSALFFFRKHKLWTDEHQIHGFEGKSDLTFSRVYPMMISLSANVQKLLEKSEARKQQEFSGVWVNVNQAWGMSSPTKFEINMINRPGATTGQETVEIHSGLWSPIMSSVTKLELNLISDLSANADKPKRSQIAKSMGPTWGPSGYCWPQMGPMLTPWTLLSGVWQMKDQTDQHTWRDGQGHSYVPSPTA